MARRRGALWRVMVVLSCLSAGSGAAFVPAPAAARQAAARPCHQRRARQPPLSCMKIDETCRQTFANADRVPNALSRLLLGFRESLERKGEEKKETQRRERGEAPDGITVRALSEEELVESGEGSKLDMVAKLCTRGMFGEEGLLGACWVLRNFNVKYGGEAAAGRQSVMLVAETSDGEIVGCVGVELMNLTDQGMAWWTNPSSIVKKRPFISDLVVDQTYRQRGLGRDLLLKCHAIVTGEWAQEIRALTASERLTVEVDNIFLKVDVENIAAVNLYSRLGYKEVARVSEELMVPKSPSAVQEWPVLNIYMQRDMQADVCAFDPLKSFKKK